MGALNQSPAKYRYKLLMERLERLGQVRGVEYRAILLDFHNTPFADSAVHTRLAMHMIESEVTLHEGETHRLGDSFLVCFADSRGQEVLKNVMISVLAMAPGHQWGGSGEDGSFITSFDIRRDLAQITRQVDRVQAAALAEEQEIERSRMRTETAAISIPVNGALPTPGENLLGTARFPATIQLEFIESQLGKVRFIELMRSQPICRIEGDGIAAVVGQELYTSIADLQKRFSTSIDMVANYQLRHHLTRHIDAILLAVLKDTHLLDRVATLHVNLSLASLKSKPFLDFEAALSTVGKRPNLELNLTDLLANAPAFRRMAPALRERGFGLVVDGLTFDSLATVELEDLPICAVKVVWASGAQLSAHAQERLARLETKGIRTILCRCDRKAAIETGQKVGIAHFQGAVVDEMTTQHFHGSCPAAASLGCSTERCRGVHWAPHRMGSLACPRPHWTSPAQ